jgi:CotH kinase protein
MHVRIQRLLLCLAAPFSVGRAASFPQRLCPIDQLVLRHGWPDTPSLTQANTPDAEDTTSLAVAPSAVICCELCVSAQIMGCDAFAFRTTDGLCLLLSSLDAGTALFAQSDAGQSAWLTADLKANSTSRQTLREPVACTPAYVSRTTPSAVLAAMREEVAHLISIVAGFWFAHGPDASAPGSFHTTLDATGKAVPPTAKTARGQSEDLEALAVLAMRASRTGDKATATRAQVLADGLYSYIVHAFAPVNGSAASPLVNEAGSTADTPQLLTTQLAITSALAAYAQATASINASAANSALCRAVRQAAAAAACCLDTSHYSREDGGPAGGGYVVKQEMAEGWYDAGTQKTLSTHLSAMHTASAIANATATLQLYSKTTHSCGAHNGVDLASRTAVPALVHATSHVFVYPNNSSNGAPYVPRYFYATWRPVETQPLAEYAPNMAVLATLLDAIRGVSIGDNVTGIVRAAASAALAASDEGYDPVFGGYYEKGAPGAGPARGGRQKLYYVQSDAVASLLWLFRHNGDRRALCKAQATLRRLATVQLAPAGEFYWAQVDQARDGTVSDVVTTPPVGMHGSFLAESWKGAGSLGSLVQLADLLDEIQETEVMAAMRSPVSAPPSWNLATASVTQHSSRPTSNASAACVGALMASSAPVATGRLLALPAHTVDVVTHATLPSCCSACMTRPECDGVAFDAGRGICAMLRTPQTQHHASAKKTAAVQNSTWRMALVSRPPLTASVQGTCPSALPTLAMDVPAASLAGIAGKSGPGPASAEVRLRLASCNNASSSGEWRARAHVRGESSRRDYAKRSFSLKMERAEAAVLAAAVGWSPPRGSKSAILYASYDDTTFLRDALTFNRSAALGLPAPRTGPLELVSGGVRQGLYYLTERPDVVAAGDDAHALVASFDPWDEGPDDVFVALPSTLGSRLRMVTPAQPSPGQVARFSGAMAALSNATSGTCDWAAFQSVADVPSWVNFVLLTEWTNDPDSYTKSMYIKLLGKLVAGPLWDKNLAFGGSTLSTTSGWRALAKCTSSCDILDNAATVPSMLLAHCPPFMGAMRTAWRAARTGNPAAVLSDEAVAAVLRDKAHRLEASGAVARDQAVWPRGRFDRDVEDMVTWLQRRSAWLDTQLLV